MPSNHKHSRSSMGVLILIIFLLAMSGKLGAEYLLQGDPIRIVMALGCFGMAALVIRWTKRIQDIPADTENPADISQ